MLPQRLWRGILALLLVFAMVPSMQTQAQANDPVLRLIEQLPTRVKVGQLAMISFPGTDLENEALVQLMKEYGIGGVWLRPENGNFGTPPVTASDFISMTNRLQELSWQAARGTDGGETAETPEASDVLTQTPYLPLFIAVESDVQGLPLTSFITGTSSTPAAMALGATWSPELTEAAGEVLGRELSALGVNFFLGPDLDVLYTPRSGDPADLGGGVLGGDPYWVGELGRAYIRGMHAGSGGALVVVPRHFPGLGSTDRPVQDEVPTVQKSLEQLKQIELAPFFAVTKSSPGTVDAADALLVTHIRYRGFQGNIRLSTRPISMDSQALQLAMEDLRPWRDAGGLLVADNLGLQSIRRFDDPSEQSFNARRVVRDALLAGNDILVMDRFAISEEWTDHFANIRDTLELLVQRYESDATFRKRVDESLYRVISLKLRIYPDFALPYVMHNPDKALESLGGGESVTEQVAMSALTRLAPFSGDLLPDPPKGGERIVIFTQEHLVALRETGTSTPMIPRDLVRQTLLRLYGAEGTGQVRSSAVQQFTFQDLLATLENPRPEVEEPAYQTLVALQNAQWIIFATTGLDASDTESTVLKAFLEQQAGLLNGRIVVFNFGPPYELDSTEISKLDLYYALYSPGEAFVQAGVQALFQDVPALGSSPVSIPALNYDLTFQTMPNPQQVISLMVVDENGNAMPEDELAAVRKDDMIYLQTGIILDRNGHPVPDGTPVQFILSYPQEENRTETVSDETSEGVAFTSLVLDRVGLVDITVQSEPATAMFHLQLTIREGESVIVFSFTPTPQPTEPSPTPTLQPSDGASYIPILPDPLRLPTPRRGALLGWGLFASLLVALSGFIWIREHETGLTKALRTGLWGVIGGMVSYLLGVSTVTWVNPAWLYRLAGREFLIGGVALAGGLVVLWVLLSPWFERFVTWVARMEMRRSERLLASGRED